MAAAPGGVRVRTRLRVGDADAAVLRQVGGFLGSLAGRDLAARCREGYLDVKGEAESRQRRKRALTGECSSRWAGAITRTSADQHRLAAQNLWSERASLRARIRVIAARLAVPVGGRSGSGKRAVRGYADQAVRHAKTLRLQTLTTRLRGVEADLAGGRVSVVRGGKALLHKRNNLTGAGLTVEQWRREWESQRLFLTADGEKDKTWGNETIRWNPEQRCLDIRLPTALAHLANRPHCRYRLSCPVVFTYRGDEVAAQAATGAVRYDISHDPDTGRWYLDASWKMHTSPAPDLDQLRRHPVVAVDLNDGHLAVTTLTPDGNLLGAARTITLDLAGHPTATRDGHLRATISDLIAHATTVGARALVIEDLDFTDARNLGRERHGNRPSRGARGRRFRRQVAGIPTGKFRDRLTQMASNAGLAIIVVDPAYTTRWGAEHWLAPMRVNHPKTSGHHAAALVIGRRGLGHRARRRVTMNPTAPAEATRVNTCDTGKPPAQARTTRTTRHPTRPAAAYRHQDRTHSPEPATVQATHDRSGPPTRQDSLLLSG